MNPATDNFIYNVWSNSNEDWNNLMSKASTTTTAPLVGIANPWTVSSSPPGDCNSNPDSVNSCSSQSGGSKFPTNPVSTTTTTAECFSPSWSAQSQIPSNTQSVNSNPWSVVDSTAVGTWPNGGSIWSQPGTAGGPASAGPSSIWSADSNSTTTTTPINSPSTPAAVAMGPSGAGQELDMGTAANTSYILQMINSPEHWGKTPVDQTIPWAAGTGSSPALGVRPCSPEANVWPNETPSGTSVWETYYDNQGEISPWLHRQQLQPKPNRWTNGGTAAVADELWSSEGQQQVWPPVSVSDSADNWSRQQMMLGRGRNEWSPDVVGGDNAGIPSMAGCGGSQHQFQGAGRRGNVASCNRLIQMRVHAIKYLMDMGFPKEAAQNALIAHQMDVDRALGDLQQQQQPGSRLNNNNGNNHLHRPPLMPSPAAGQGAHLSTPEAALSAQQQALRHQVMSQLRSAVQNKLAAATAGGNGTLIPQLCQLMQPPQSRVPPMAQPGLIRHPPPQYNPSIPHPASAASLASANNLGHKMAALSRLWQQQQQDMVGRSAHTNKQMALKFRQAVDQLAVRLSDMSSPGNTASPSNGGSPFSRIGSQTRLDLWPGGSVSNGGGNSHSNYVDGGAVPPFGNCASMNRGVTGTPTPPSCWEQNHSLMMNGGGSSGNPTRRPCWTEPSQTSPPDMNHVNGTRTPATYYSGGTACGQQQMQYQMTCGNGAVPATGGWLVVRHLNPYLAESAQAVCQSLGSLVSFHTHQHQASWALARFTNREDSVRAQRLLYGHNIPSDLLSTEQEVILFLRELSAGSGAPVVPSQLRSQDAAAMVSANGAL